MKTSVKLILTVATLLCFFETKAQNNTKHNNYLSDTPILSKAQMLADYDSLIS